MLRRCLFLLAVTLAVQGNQQRPFDPNRFPPSKFAAEHKRFTFGPLTIQLTQVIPLRYGGDDPLMGGCSAFVEVRRGSQLLDARSFETIFPGSPLGLILLKRQPLADYFMLVKTGGYDSRTILVGTDGKIQDVDGSRVVIDRVDGWLINESNGAEDGTVQIFDYRQGTLIFRQHYPEFRYREIGQWYRWHSRLFITLFNSEGVTEE